MQNARSGGVGFGYIAWVSGPHGEKGRKDGWRVWHAICNAEGMRVAIPLWEGRVSPVFDEASRILLVDIEQGRERHRREEALVAHNPFERAEFFPRLGVEVLVCGMISQTQRAALSSAGIRIIPHICGSMDEVIGAVLDGRIESGALLMPGCGGDRVRRRRCRSAREKRHGVE